MLAEDRDRPREAAALIGAADQLGEELDTALDDFERALVDAVKESARARLGEDGFSRAFAYGCSLLLEDAAALALP
jgi:hypothetical protein